MITQEIININNLKLKHTYSSTNKYIKQVETNTIYPEVYDTLKRNYHYIETEQEIEKENEIENVPQQ
ncbi:MAG: hypothetical protein IJ458_01020 [Clostridia bacterium]|nr:hypothetical protein [Clostridia bacterium]